MLRHSVDKCVAPNLARTPQYTMEQLRGLFKRYDSNRDGRLSRKELKAAFKHLGASFPGWRAHRALNHADGNRDGYISEEEIEDLVNYAVKLGYAVVKYK